MKRFKSHVSRSLVAGSFIFLPVAITYVLVRWVFDSIDGLLQPLVHEFLGRTIPGVGLVSLLFILYLLGLIWRKRLGQRVVRTLQQYLLRLPVVGSVYGPMKKLIESLSSDSTAGFKRVVVVEYPKQDTWMIGFLTSVCRVSTGTIMGVVYLPTAPMPNSGWVTMIPIEKVYDTRMSVQDAMSMVLSGGISSPPDIELTAMDARAATELLDLGGADPRQQVSSEAEVFNLPFMGKQTNEEP